MRYRCVTRGLGFVLGVLGAWLLVAGLTGGGAAFVACGSGLVAVGIATVNRNRGWGAPGEASPPEDHPPPQGPSQTRAPNRDF